MLIYPFSIFWLKLKKSVFTYFRRVTLVFTLSFLKGLPNSTKYTPQESEKRDMSKSSHMTAVITPSVICQLMPKRRQKHLNKID